MKILLDYFFKITAIVPTAAASTAFLRQACLVVKPKVGVTTGEATLCTNMTQVAALTDNTEAQQFFDAGMSRIYILPMDDLNLATALTTYKSLFFTLLISGDFTKDDVVPTAASLVKGDLTFTAVEEGFEGNDISIEFLDTVSAGSEEATVVGNAISVAIEGGVSTATQIKAALDAEPDVLELITTAIASGQGAVAQAAFAEDNLEGGDTLALGTFDGVVGISSDDKSFLEAQGAVENRCAFYDKTANKAKNMVYAFGKLLSNTLNWSNQQYIPMPLASDVDEVGECEDLFDKKVSFVLVDDEYANRLGLFIAGGKAIVAPYIIRNLTIDLQSKALTYVTANQPSYTKKQASLLEDELNKVISGDDSTPGYVGKGWIESGSVEIKLEQDDFVGSGYIKVAKPRALWRLLGELTQS